jgi:hypothetical protein
MNILKNVKYKIGCLPPASWKVGDNLIKRTIEEWVADPRTKKSHIDCKHMSLASCLKEFRSLNNVKEYFITYHDQNENWKDDSIEIWYRT